MYTNCNRKNFHSTPVYKMKQNIYSSLQIVTGVSNTKNSSHRSVENSAARSVFEPLLNSWHIPLYLGTRISEPGSRGGDFFPTSRVGILTWRGVSFVIPSSEIIMGKTGALIPEV